MYAASRASAAASTTAAIAAARCRAAGLCECSLLDCSLDLPDRSLFVITDPIAAQAHEALLAGLGHAVREGDDELPVLVQLLRRRLVAEQRHGIGEMLERSLLELLGRVVAGVIHLRLGAHDLVKQFALAVLLAGFGVCLRHGEVSRMEPPRSDVITSSPALGGPSRIVF